MGEDVLRLSLSLATFNSVTTRMCRGQQKTITSQFQTSAINRVPEPTARVLLPTTDPLIIIRPLSDSAHCTVSASNTIAQYFKDVSFSLLPDHVDCVLPSHDSLESLSPTFFYG